MAEPLCWTMDVYTHKRESLTSEKETDGSDVGTELMILFLL
jgi:hypothetical protein